MPVRLLLFPGLLVLAVLSVPPARPLAARAAPIEGLLTRALAAGFVENRGQVDGPVRFYLPGGAQNLYFTPEAVIYALHSRRAGDAGARRWVVRQEFVAAAPEVRVVGEEAASGTVSYFRGRPAEWKTGLRTYASLRYRELWPGIDLVYQAQGGRLKYEYRVAPGADPQRILLAIGGATEVAVTGTGDLRLSTPVGEIVDSRPVAYQETEGRRVPVACEWHIRSRGGGGARVGFALGRYDPRRPLIIDPVVLVWSGFIGGTDHDGIHDLAVDGEGNVYVVGQTASAPDSFPLRVGPDLSFNGPRDNDDHITADAFVAKIRADGSGLEYCGYIGGRGYDAGRGIAVDTEGAAYVVGLTQSPTSSFPVRQGPDLTFNKGYQDVFVAKVRPDGRALEYCGYLGGNRWDTGTGAAVDPRGRLYVTGATESDSRTFPVRVGPDLTFNGAFVRRIENDDAFVARVSADGARLEYCGYVGGNRGDYPKEIAVDATGHAYLAGFTASWHRTFPVKGGPDLSYNGGEVDAFVAKVRADGRALEYCGYIGGRGSDSASGIAVDRHGAAYLTGITGSTGASFPTLVGPDLTANGQGEAWVAKVAPGGARLEYSGFIGGRDLDGGAAVDVGPDGSAYVVGSTASPETTFPVRAGPDLTSNGSTDVFVARVRPGGRGLVFCGYLGGRRLDFGTAIRVDARGQVYVGGITESNTFPARVGPELEFRGGYHHDRGWGDGFIARIGTYPAPSRRPGRLRASARRLVFGRAPVGKPKRARLRLRNAGPGVLRVNVPPLPPPFTVVPTGDLFLPPRSRRTLTVTFTPQKAREYVRGLALTSSDPQQPLFHVPVYGRGVAE